MSRAKRPSDRTKKVDPFYLSAEWRKTRKRVLRRDVMCVECSERLSSHCDHIKPRRLFPELSLDESNLRGLCESCHNTRSARQYSATSGGIGENGEPLDPSHPWHAGEAARVSFKGTNRSPESWQVPTLRAATPAVTQPPQQSVPDDYFPMSLPEVP